MPPRSTCSGLRVRTPSDARIVFHAVALNVLPMITRRLDTDERNSISPGDVYVWEERGASQEATGTGIERWTDGIRWGPSRVRDGFLFYREKQDDNVLYSAAAWRPSQASRNDAAQYVLTKQTYTVNISTANGTRKWHLIAYFTEATLNKLATIDQIAHLASLVVPHERYVSARAVKGRPDHIFNTSPQSNHSYPRLEYVPYQPRSSSRRSSSSHSHARHDDESPPESPSQHFNQAYSPLQTYLHAPLPQPSYLRSLAYPGNEASAISRRMPEDERVLRMFSSPAN